MQRENVPEMSVKEVYDARDPQTAAWLLINKVPYLGATLNYHNKVYWRFSNREPYSDAAWQLALQWRYEAEGDREALTGYLPEFMRAYREMTHAASEARANGTNANSYEYKDQSGSQEPVHDRRRIA